MIMRRRFFNVCVVLSLLFGALLSSCTEDVPDYREQEYGYAQFKLYKEASYQPAAKSDVGSRAVQTMLDRLGEAHKIKVTLSFDETTIIAYTDYGELTVTGNNLHISSLDIDKGEMSVDGTVNSLVYINQGPKATGFFSKVFR